MTRASLFALIAAAGLAAPSIASAECHLAGADGTAGAHEAPTAAEGTETAEVESELDEEGLDPPEDSAILPSAGGHTDSEAPTMEIDCEAHPELCTGDPLQRAVEGPALSEGGDPAEANGHNAAGEAVVAEPDC